MKAVSNWREEVNRYVRESAKVATKKFLLDTGVLKIRRDDPNGCHPEDDGDHFTIREIVAAGEVILSGCPSCGMIYIHPDYEAAIVDSIVHRLLENQP